MLELTGVASVLRGISILYWILAASTVALVLWKVRPRWRKAVGALVVVCIFSYLPAQRLIEASKREAYAREAWAYFRKLCDEKSGENIYKTFTGVKSVLVVKALPPATERDLYDQFWYGDPYSGGLDDRAKSSAVNLIGSLESRGISLKSPAKRMGFDFVESLENWGSETRYVKYTQPNPKDWAIRTEIAKPVSRFGVSWEDISSPEDRKYWVAASRLRVIDLKDDTVVAERIGFLIESGFGSTAGKRRPWLSSRGPNTTCPKIESSIYEDRRFIHKVLNPGQGS